MTQSEDASVFLANLDPSALQVGNGSDGLPVWIGVDAEAQKVYKVYANGLAQGFGDGRMIIINGLLPAHQQLQVTSGRHLMLSGESGALVCEADPAPVFKTDLER
ncbi:hypothetical protein [Comamonas sp. B-9]|uniref:hypothetical protein n=1 Tax=Comamonas sp. B-9 TaxID=1055192 RepID=UPI0003957D08|nr:hypothetical protein [Comamonas sp. B-9]